MASLPPIKRITKEDLKEAPNWINQLLSPINSFFEATYSALDKNLSLGDNIAGNIVTITFYTKSTYGTLPLTDNWEVVNVNNPLKTRPRAVLIGQITDTTNYSVITDPNNLHWDYLNGTIRLKYISGLTASKKYEINLLVF